MIASEFGIPAAACRKIRAPARRQNRRNRVPRPPPRPGAFVVHGRPRMKQRLLAAGAVAWLGWKLLQKSREASLDGSVVVITGGSRGLGLLLAREFGRHGCRVAVCARDEAELDAARADFARRGIDALTFRCDVSDRADVEIFIDRVIERFGGIDILVNNAGIIQVGPLNTMRIEDFERAMAINFWGAVYATYAVLPYMRRRGRGRIVNITSIGGKVAIPHLLPYDCAKFALVAFSEGAATELAADGIAVTTIVPGLMRTGSASNALFKGSQQREFDWFSLGSATPLTAISAERAARRIVAATRRGEAVVTLSWQANLLRTFHGALPSASVRILSGVNRLLPQADPEKTAEARGVQFRRPALTAMMDHAARRTHQFAGAGARH